MKRIERLLKTAGIWSFWGRGSILLPLREHYRGVNIFLSWLLNFQGSPRGDCWKWDTENDTWFGDSRWWHCELAQKNCIENLMTRSAQTKKNCKH